MDEFKRIQMSSLLILLLQFTGAAIGQVILSLSVRAGDEATLPCNNVTHDQDECDGTTWIFTDSGSSGELVGRGQIGDQANSDRLRVTEKCSLVIKKVTEEDAGYYLCSQFNKADQQEGSGSFVDLSVVTITEHQDNDEVTLNCSVKTDGPCDHSAKWLLQGQDVDKENRYLKTSQSLCSASVTFLTSLFSYATSSELLTCEVTNEFTEVHMFPFSPQSSGEDTTTTTTTTTESDSRSGLLRHIIVPVSLAALIMIVVAVNIWTRAKEKKTQMDEINVRYDVDDGTVNYENIRPPDGV